MADNTKNSDLGTCSQAQLWLGDPTILQDHVTEYLCKHYCPKNGCLVCRVCISVRKQEHHSVLWIEPERTYTVEHIKPIFEQTTLALDHGASFFFILGRCEYLSATCANRLLKIIEEPPPGYHFVLLAQRRDMILPTIRSRCVITSYSEHDMLAQTHPLAPLLLTSTTDPIMFLKTLNASKITERETGELLDLMLKLCMTEYKKNKQSGAVQKLTIIKSTLGKPIMPGSSKMVLRNIFLQLHK